MPKLLAIDIGTSACKAALFDETGAVIAQQSEEYPVYYPREGWAEQDPEQWWEAVCKAIREMLLRSGVTPGEIAGIGVDGQSWSAIPMDGEGKALCNTPIWFDTRSTEICERLKARIGEKEIFSVCGNPVQPGYSLPKILWFRENHQIGRAHV